MSGLTVVIDRSETIVRMDCGTVRVDRPDSKPERIPLHLIQNVIVIGSPMVACDVWRNLSQNNISAVFFPARGNGEAAYIGPELSLSMEHRISQYRTYFNKPDALNLAKRLCFMKITGQAELIKEVCTDQSVDQLFYEKMIAYREKTKNARDVEHLMGLEGVAAAFYFKWLGKCIPEKWNFTGRNRRPPRDPVNTFMSLSYVLACGDIKQAINKKGLDPSIGFLHASQPGRHNLVLDILEPIRPKIDRFILKNLLTSFTLKDFSTNPQDGCMLNKHGRKLFFHNWTEWKHTNGNNMAFWAEGVLKEVIESFTG